MDERVCCDTILRVVRLDPRQYIVYDILVLNGVRIHDSLTFAQRQERIAEILELFHGPDLAALMTIADAPVGTHVRGYEQYDGEPGTIGVYLPKVE
jgi:hydroxyacyl-ACP dehydratase HTD2-like protein with hotdog domain